MDTDMDMTKKTVQSDFLSRHLSDTQAPPPPDPTTHHSLVRRDWRSCAFTLLELFLRLLADEEAEDETPGAAVYEGFSLPFAQIEAAALQAVAERQFQGDISLGLRSLVTQVGVSIRCII